LDLLLDVRAIAMAPGDRQRDKKPAEDATQGNMAGLGSARHGSL
jgi:hypothetical protein